MRVIDQTRLAFREGTSDKVYEIDLVEVATNQYVVNFRFGRRGSALKDGTKTATPVPLAKARSIFDKLVAEKTAGGYRPEGSAKPASSGNGAARVDDRDRRDDDDGDDDDSGDEDEEGHNSDASLIERLQRGHRGYDPLGPIVWRVGDRDLKDAEPVLLEIIDRPARGVAASAWQHTVLGALVRCGTTASLPRLEQIVEDRKRAQHVRDVARLAIVQIDSSRAAALARALMPSALLPVYERRDIAALARATEELLARHAVEGRNAAVGLYLLDTTATPSASSSSPTRAAVLAIARVARLNNDEATAVRALFRLAELRRDGELYALLARRIDDFRGYYRPFGVRTVRYFRRRVARVLRRLGRAGSPDYTRMAAAILRSYTDDDAQPVMNIGGYSWDRFARFHALNDILYGNSQRYVRAHHDRSAWRCTGGYRPGNPPPDQREERFVDLWDRVPEQLWELLTGAPPAAPRSAARITREEGPYRALVSAVEAPADAPDPATAAIRVATPVVEFAARALRGHRAFVDTLSDAVVGAVLGAGHPLAQRLVYDLVKHRPITAALARGALESTIVEANVWVLLWVASHPDEVAADPELLALLVTGKTDAIRDAASAILRGRTLSEPLGKNAAARAIAIMLGFGADDEARARGVSALVLSAFAPYLLDIGPEVLRDMIGHPLSALGELAGELVLRHGQRDRLPHDLLETMLASPHAAVRALGAQLLATTPVEIAKDDLEALELFSTSGNRELREGTRTLIGRVAIAYPEVGRALADRLVDALLAAQQEGVPAHIVSLLRSELAATLPQKPAATILKLVGALSPHAREAGGLLLAQLDPDELGLDDIARLASHEILAIRHGAWALARASVARYRVAPVAVSRLVDSPWQDTRDFAFDFIRSELATQLTADAIIAICDSIRPEVQALGKALLHERFTEADAGHYLVRLSEHPSQNLQLLVSGMLEHHVGHDLERLRAILPYLVTVLSQVNRGKVAKQRVMDLVRREAARTPEGAALLAPLLDRQSATIAITQKHPLIATMVEVRETYPDIALPIEVVPPARHPDVKAEPTTAGGQ